MSYQTFRYQIIPFNGCRESKTWAFCNAENLQRCVIFWLFSGIYFNTEQYSLTAFISFKKDVLTIFSVALWCNKIKATNGKRERMSMCASVYVVFFFFNNTKCLPCFTYYWDQVTKDAKKEAAKLILYVQVWINSLLNEFHCWLKRKIFNTINSHCFVYWCFCIRCCNHHSYFPSYNLNGSLCISQAIRSLPNTLWGSHFLSWILSMWPACPVHTDTPVQPVWHPVYCWSYGMVIGQYLNLIQCCSELGLLSSLLDL